MKQFILEKCPQIEGVHYRGCPIQRGFTVYLRYMFIIYALYIHYICSPFPRYMFIICSLYIHYVYSKCLLYIRYIFTVSSIFHLPGFHLLGGGSFPRKFFLKKN